MSRPLLAALFFLGVLAALVLSDCNDKKCPPNSPCPTPTPPPNFCTNIAGSRNSFWNDTCNNSGAGVAVVSQAQCSFSAALSGFGTITGTVSGNNLSYTIALSQTNCTASATGTGSISGVTITGNYSVTPTGNCCPTGSFTMQFAPTPSTSVTPGVTLTPTP